MTVRIAIVSDLHCHATGSTPQQSFLLTDALREPAGNHPVEALTRNLLVPQQLRANIVLAPGDLTDRIGQQGLVSGWDYVREISDALGADMVVATCGNHDVDSKKSHGPDPFRLPKGLSRGYPVSDTTARQSYWANGFSVVDGAAARIIAINSVAEHFDEPSAKRGTVSAELIARLDAHLRPLAAHPKTIALVHHHPIQHELTGMTSDDLMVHGQELLECLATHGVRLVVHGHKHYPRIRYFDAAGSTVVVFAAGSFAAMNANMLRTTNLFHILELPDRTLAGCTMLGRVFSWEYGYGHGWTSAHSRSADMPSIAGFGCTCDPSSMADEVAAFVHAMPESLIPWIQVEAQFPRVAFVPPAQFKVMAQRLNAEYGLRVMPELGEPPEMLVRVSGANP